MRSARGDEVCAVVCADLDEARRDDADGRDDIAVVRVACAGGCECAVAFGGVCTVVFGDDASLPTRGARRRFRSPMRLVALDLFVRSGARGVVFTRSSSNKRSR